MKDQNPRLGIDRFLALRWVDMALELRASGTSKTVATDKLSEWLSHEINGKEVVRKTINQINRMWFSDLYSNPSPGNWMLQNGLEESLTQRPMLHYGMALLAFPLFQDVCLAVGRLSKLQGKSNREEIKNRVLEKYSNPASTTRAIDRILQTLVDWGILQTTEKAFISLDIPISDPKLIEWLILVLLLTYKTDQIPLVDISNAPELIGIRFLDIRGAIRSASQLRIEYGLGMEKVVLLK